MRWDLFGWRRGRRLWRGLRRRSRGVCSAGRPQVRQQDAQQYAQQAPPPPAAAAAPAEDDATAQLQNLAQLHQQGVLTDEEFAAAKAKILGI